MKVAKAFATMLSAAAKVESTFAAAVKAAIRADEDLESEIEALDEAAAKHYDKEGNTHWYQCAKRAARLMRHAEKGEEVVFDGKSLRAWTAATFDAKPKAQKAPKISIPEGTTPAMLAAWLLENKSAAYCAATGKKLRAAE